MSIKKIENEEFYSSLSQLELTPKTCLGYNYPGRRKKVMAHICNKCYNPEKGYDMDYFDQMNGKWTTQEMIIVQLYYNRYEHYWNIQNQQRQP